MPRVSVVIPCYNAAPYIAATVHSALRQTYADLEVIVVDDDSRDGSAEVVAAIDDPRLRLLRQPNGGPAAARNTGIRAARGPYIAFLDADDLALPHRLADQVAALDADPALTAIAGGYVWIDEQGRALPGFHSWQAGCDLNSLHDWLFDCPVVPSVVTMRRRAWQAVGGFDESFVGPEDWHFWLRLVLGGHRMRLQRDVVAHYRRLPSSVSSDGSRMVRQCTRVLAEIRQHPAFPRTLDGACQRAIGLRYLDGAKRQFAAGWWREGRASLAQAVALDPSLLHGAPCRVELELVNLALDPLIVDPLLVLHTTFAFLPQAADELRVRRDAAVCRYHLVRVDLCLQARRWRDAAAHALLAWSLRPSLPVDRAVWRSWATTARRAAASSTGTR